MKQPIYTQIAPASRPMWECGTCGSVVTVQGKHNKWHEEQALTEAEKQERLSR